MTGVHPLLNLLFDRIEAANGLHVAQPNSVSALHPEPLCLCGKTAPCPTHLALHPECATTCIHAKDLT